MCADSASGHTTEVFCHARQENVIVIIVINDVLLNVVIAVIIFLITVFFLWLMIWLWQLLLVSSPTYKIVSSVKHLYNYLSRFDSCPSKPTLDYLTPSDFLAIWLWHSWWWALPFKFTLPGRRQTGTQTELWTSAVARTYLCNDFKLKFVLLCQPELRTWKRSCFSAWSLF